MSSRARPQAGLWLRLCIIACYPLLWLFFRRRLLHGERLGDGPAIIVANHVSHVDPVIIGSVLWDNGIAPHFLAKSSLFRVPLVGRALYGTGQVPVERGSVQAKDSLQAAVDVLKAGERVIVYPEGTVTRDPAGWPMVGKTGAARLAQLVPGVPVIPIGQWGAQHSVDLYRKRIRLRPRRTVTYSVGETLDLTAFSGNSEPENLRAATDVMMRAIREQVAEIRGQRPPERFYRPGVDGRAGGRGNGA